MAVGQDRKAGVRSSKIGGSHLQAEALTTNVLGEHNRTTRSGRCFAEEDVKAPIVNPPPPSRKRQKLSQAAERQEASQRPPQLSKAAQQRDSAPQSRPASAKRAHIPEENLRTVRPRPLHIKDKVKVFWGTQADRVQDVDNGAFAHWLQRAEQEQRLGADPAALVGSCQAQVMVVGHEFKASSQTHNVAKVPSPSKAPAPQPQSSRIAIPAYRRLQPPKDPGEQQPPGSEAAYIRYVPPDEDDLEAEVEYDLDEDDLAWLVKQRSCLTRAHRTALTDSMLEQALDRCEKACHAAAKLRLAHHKSESSQEPAFDDLDELFPSDAACQACKDLELDPCIVEAVHKHWLAKRADLGRPLLPRLWFEQPWAQQIGKTAQAAEAHQEDAEDEADEEPHASCMPFMGRDTPKGPTGRGRPLGLQQACELIWAIRADLDTARTAADQVRRKEKQHKQQLAGHVATMRTMLSSRRSASKGQPRSLPELATEVAHEHHIPQLVAGVARQAGQLGNIDMPDTDAAQSPQPSEPASALSSASSASAGSALEQPPKPRTRQQRGQAPEAEESPPDAAACERRPGHRRTEAELLQAQPLQAQLSRKRRRAEASKPSTEAPSPALPVPEPAHPPRPDQLAAPPRRKAAPVPPSQKKSRLQPPPAQPHADDPPPKPKKGRQQQQQQQKAQQSQQVPPAGKPRKTRSGPAQQEASKHDAPAPSTGRHEAERGQAAKQGARKGREDRAAAQAAPEPSTGTSASEAAIPAAGPALAVRSRQHARQDHPPASPQPGSRAGQAAAEPRVSTVAMRADDQPAVSPSRSQRKPLAKPVQVPASKWPGLRRLIAQIGLPQFRLYSQASGHIKAHRGRQLRSRPIASLAAPR